MAQLGEEDESMSLNEVITLPMYDFKNLTLEKMQELQTMLSCKEKQEQLIREHKRRHVLHIVKEFFVDASKIADLNNKHTILDQLVFS